MLVLKTGNHGTKFLTMLQGTQIDLEQLCDIQVVGETNARLQLKFGGVAVPGGDPYRTAIIVFKSEADAISAANQLYQEQQQAAAARLEMRKEREREALTKVSPHSMVYLENTIFKLFGVDRIEIGADETTVNITYASKPMQGGQYTLSIPTATSKRAKEVVRTLASVLSEQRYNPVVEVRGSTLVNLAPATAVPESAATPPADTSGVSMPWVGSQEVHDAIKKHLGFSNCPQNDLSAARAGYLAAVEVLKLKLEQPQPPAKPVAKRAPRKTAKKA